MVQVREARQCEMRWKTSQNDRSEYRKKTSESGEVEWIKSMFRTILRPGGCACMLNKGELVSNLAVRQTSQNKGMTVWVF